MPYISSNPYGTIVVYCSKAGVPITVYALNEQEKRIQSYIVETQQEGKSLCAAIFRLSPGSYEVIEPKHPEMKGDKYYVTSGQIWEVNLVFGC